MSRTKYPLYRVVFNPTPEVQYCEEPGAGVFIAQFYEADLALEYAANMNNELEKYEKKTSSDFEVGEHVLAFLPGARHCTHCIIRNSRKSLMYDIDLVIVEPQPKVSQYGFLVTIPRDKVCARIEIKEHFTSKEP